MPRRVAAEAQLRDWRRWLQGVDPAGAGASTLRIGFARGVCAVVIRCSWKRTTGVPTTFMLMTSRVLPVSAIFPALGPTGSL